MNATADGNAPLSGMGISPAARLQSLAVAILPAMAIMVDWNFPVRLRAGAGEGIYLHAILETLGIFIAFRVYLRQRRKGGDAISGANRLWILIAATFGAVLGSHVLGALENLPAWRSSAQPWAYFWGNKTLVGGLLGGLWAVEGIKLAIGERQRSGDLFVIPLLIGMLIGRIGCFSMGVFEETYGLPSRLPWALNLGDGIPRHPVALYELVFLSLLVVLIGRLRKRYTFAPGGVFKLFMIAYLGFRFCLDFIKPGSREVFGLGSIQIACICGLLYYYPYLLSPRRLLCPKIPADAG